MKLRFIEWIWHVSGSLTLAPNLSSDEAFDRLDPLFRQTGTSHERTKDTLIFRKKDQAAQDKMAVFDSGVLKIEKSMAGTVLRYHLASRALLFCFLAPLMFLSFALLTIAVDKAQKPSSKAEEKSAQEKTALPMNPIDKFLGAPEPEKPKKEGAEKDKNKDEDKDKKLSPTPAYVFAAIFAILYVVGRILEDRLIKALFKKSLLVP